MDRRVLRAYAAGLTALTLSGAWLAVSSDVMPGAAPAPVAAPAPADAGVQRDLALAAAYRDAAARVSAAAPGASAAPAAPAPVVSVTTAPPVASTRSS